ncbi:PKD domain-containing protein [candidate division KSB1 bacterium]|nr:PKD domain-containing protein [candidate division KSB1 bacterium]
MKFLSISSRLIHSLLVVTMVLGIGILIQCSDDSKSIVKPKINEFSNILSYSNPKIQQIAKIQQKHTNKIMSIPGVVGMGIGLSDKGKEVIRVFTMNSDVTGIPHNLENIDVDVKVTGMFVFFSDPTARFPRPVPIGVSTGHPAVTAGTISCRVKDNQGRIFALSNNHVFANSNDAQIGDNIIQPGAYDGGTSPADAIGTLYDFEPVKFDGSDNMIDAAVTLTTAAQVNCTTLPDGYGAPASTTVSAFIGQQVQKFGRTTRLTYGHISELNVTLNVCYECNDPGCWSCAKMARFVGQIAVVSNTPPDEFSAGGDSGSLIVTDDENKNPVALLFAGSPSRTIANPIDLVLQRFNVTIDDGGSGNTPPAADFNININDLTAEFTDNSSDPDGSVVSWSWDFGDGTTSTEQNVTHTYAADGSYSVALTVMDDGGAAGSTSQTVYIGDLPNIPPTSNFSFNISGLDVTFTDESSDPDGQITAWNWNFGDGSTSTEQNPVHTFANPGLYAVQLTITDDDGDTGSATKNVNIIVVDNDPPVADFTYTTLKLLAKFTDQSTDPDNNIIAWSWDFGDGTGSMVQNPNHNYAASGTYTVTLTVTDSKLATGTASQTISVSGTSNNPPVADFSYTTTNLTAYFTDLSTDPDNNIIAWNWGFGDGGGTMLQNPNHTYTSAGTYIVTLTVTDSKLATSSISKSVTVETSMNQPPVADFTFTVSGLEVTFSDQSTDPDGNITATNWNFGDGSTSNEQNPVHSYAAGGTYIVTLTVTDNNQAANSIFKAVTVETSVNQPPIADFTFTVSELEVTFSDQSTDPDGSIQEWNWNFGDGSTSNEQNPVHSYAAGGTYIVTLTVTDNNQATNSIFKAVTVLGTSNHPPVADFSYTIDNLSVYFTDLSTDPDNNIIAWSWDFGDGGTSPIQNSSHTYDAGGTYTVTLTVTDLKLETGTTSKSVTVEEPVNMPPVADFGYSASDLSVTFTDLSTDADGYVVGWNWNFGDGWTSTEQNPAHTYAQSGTFNVQLIVTDDDGDTDVVTKTVTVTGGSPENITLNAMDYTNKNRNIVDLDWTGAATSKIDIFRNSEYLLSTKNDGYYTDIIGKSTGTFVYQIREQGSSNWSNEVTVTF